MHEITIHYNDALMALCIDKYKVLIGNNYERKFKVCQQLQAVGLNRKDSQLDEDHNTTLDMMLDGNRMSSKMVKSYVFNGWWRLDVEAKMGTNSLTKDFLLAKLSDIQYNADIVAMNQYIDIFNENFLAGICDYGQYGLSFKVKSLTENVLFKQIETKMVYEDVEYDDMNTGIVDRLAIFLNMVHTVALNDKVSNYCVILDVPVFDDAVRNLVEKKIAGNLMVIIHAGDLKTAIDCEDLMVCNEVNYDFMNEETLYLLIMEYGIGTDITTCREYLQGVLNSKDTRTINQFYLEKLK